MDEEIRSHLDQKRYTEAFERVLEQYEQKVFRLAYSMLGNRALAEDAAQEILVRIWRALPAYRGLSSLSTWIFAITRNACLSALRSGGRAKLLSLEEPAVRVAAEARLQSGSGEDRSTDISGLVEQLPEKYRQVVTLFYMQEKSYAEVAELLDLPMGTVKTYLHRARKDLAAALIESKMKEGTR